jgi:tRNA A37 threonylcarbamoyladenosine modification protein TsaB
MTIEIFLQNDEITISLKNKRKIIDSIKLKEDRSLSKIILSEIDNLLKNNKVPKKQVKTVSVKNTLPDSYTSSRIAKSLAKSFNFSQKTI